MRTFEALAAGRSSYAAHSNVKEFLGWAARGGPSRWREPRGQGRARLGPSRPVSLCKRVWVVAHVPAPLLLDFAPRLRARPQEGQGQWCARGVRVRACMVACLLGVGCECQAQEQQGQEQQMHRLTAAGAAGLLCVCVCVCVCACVCVCVCVCVCSPRQEFASLVLFELVQPMHHKAPLTVAAAAACPQDIVHRLKAALHICDYPRVLCETRGSSPTCKAASKLRTMFRVHKPRLQGPQEPCVVVVHHG